MAVWAMIPLMAAAGTIIWSAATGADVFVFGAESETDVIEDFHAGEDRILIQDGYSADDVEVSSHGGSTFITFGGNTVILQGQHLGSGPGPRKL